MDNAKKKGKKQNYSTFPTVKRHKMSSRNIRIVLFTSW